MESRTPRNWIITAFILAIFGIVTFGALCRNVYRGRGTNLTNLRDTIEEKNRYIANLQDTIIQKNKDILNLKQTLNKRNSESPQSRLDKDALNSFTEKLKEKDRIIRKKEAEIKKLQEKMDFINSL